MAEQRQLTDEMLQAAIADPILFRRLVDKLKRDDNKEDAIRLERMLRRTDSGGGAVSEKATERVKNIKFRDEARRRIEELQTWLPRPTYPPLNPLKDIDLGSKIAKATLLDLPPALYRDTKDLINSSFPERKTEPTEQPDAATIDPAFPIPNPFVNKDVMAVSNPLIQAVMGVSTAGKLLGREQPELPENLAGIGRAGPGALTAAGGAARAIGQGIGFFDRWSGSTIRTTLGLQDQPSREQLMVDSMADLVVQGQRESFEDMVEDPVKQANEDPFMFALNLVDIAGVTGSVAGRILRASRVARAGSTTGMLSILRGANNLDEAAGVVRNLNNATDTMGDASRAARAAGETGIADDIARNKQALEELKSELKAKKIAPEVEAAAAAEHAKPKKDPLVITTRARITREAKSRIRALGNMDESELMAQLDGLTDQLNQQVAVLPDEAQQAVRGLIKRAKAPGVRAAGTGALRARIAEIIEELDRGVTQGRKAAPRMRRDQGAIREGLFRHMAGGTIGGAAALAASLSEDGETRTFNVGDWMFVGAGTVAGARIFGRPQLREAMLKAVGLRDRPQKIAALTGALAGGGFGAAESEDHPFIGALIGAWVGSQAAAAPFGLRRTPIDFDDLPDFERVAVEFFDFLPDKYITPPVARRHAEAGILGLSAAGGAALGGFQEEEFNIGGAVVGGLAGGVFGIVPARGGSSLINHGWNPKRSMLRMFTESAGMPSDYAKFKALQRNRVRGIVAEIWDTNVPLARAAKANPELGNDLDRVLNQLADPDIIEDLDLRNRIINTRLLYDRLALELVKEAVAHGELADTILTNLGKYSPRVYAKYLDADVGAEFMSWAHQMGIDDVVKRAPTLEGLMEKGWFQVRYKGEPKTFTTRRAANAFIKDKNLPKDTKIHKIDIPARYRERWGEISAEFGTGDPGRVALKRQIQTAHGVEFARRANWIAASEHVIPDEIAAQIASGKMPAGFSIVSEDPTRVIIQQGSRRFQQVPDRAAFGNLRGRWLDVNIAADFEIEKEVTTALQRVLSKGLAIFKASKVTYNPSTLLRNVFGEGIMSNMAGVPLHRPDMFWQGMADYAGAEKFVGVTGGLLGAAAGGAGSTELGVGPLPGIAVGALFGNKIGKALGRAGVVKGRPDRYLRARRAGLFGGEYVPQEIRSLVEGTVNSPATTIPAKTIDWVIDHMTDPINAMPGFHQASEQAFKMVTFNYAVDVLKMTDEDAVRYAKRWNFDYQDIPGWIKIGRTNPVFGAPFITFTYKALPRVMENALSIGDPRKAWRFWKYPLATGGVNEWAFQHFGIVDDDDKSILPTMKRIMMNGLGIGDLEGIKPLMADYVGAQQILVPTLDAFDRFVLGDGTWWFPWGDMGEFGKGQIGKGLAEAEIWFPRQFEPAMPGMQLFMGLTLQKNPFTGRDIVPPSERGTPLWAVRNIEFIAQTMAPALFPFAGFGAKKLQRAGVPPFTGEFTQAPADILSDPDTPSPLAAYFATFLGLPTRPVDVDRALEYKESDLDKKVAGLRREFTRTWNSLSPTYADQVSQFLTTDDEAHLKGIPRSERNKARRIRRAAQKIIEANAEFDRRFAKSVLLPSTSSAEEARKARQDALKKLGAGN